MNSNPMERQSVQDLTPLKAEQQHRFANADRLCTSQEFQWFLEQCVCRRAATAQATALDPKKSPDERERAVHVLAAIAEIRDWAAAERDDARKNIESLNRP